MPWLRGSMQKVPSSIPSIVWWKEQAVGNVQDADMRAPASLSNQNWPWWTGEWWPDSLQSSFMCPIVLKLEATIFLKQGGVLQDQTSPKFRMTPKTCWTNTATNLKLSSNEAVRYFPFSFLDIFPNSFIGWLILWDRKKEQSLFLPHAWFFFKLYQADFWSTVENCQQRW